MPISRRHLSSATHRPSLPIVHAAPDSALIHISGSHFSFTWPKLPQVLVAGMVRARCGLRSVTPLLRHIHLTGLVPTPQIHEVPPTFSSGAISWPTDGLTQVTCKSANVLVYNILNRIRVNPQSRFPHPSLTANTSFASSTLLFTVRVALEELKSIL